MSTRNGERLREEIEMKRGEERVGERIERLREIERE